MLTAFLLGDFIMAAPTYPLTLVRGKTLDQPLLYAESFLLYRAIAEVVSLAPLRVRTAAAHGIPDNWPVRIQGVTQPSEMNSAEGSALTAFVVEPDVVEFNTLDASSWGAFVVSGHLVFNQPADLTGWVIRMHVRDKIGGTMLLSFSSDPADSPDGTIALEADMSAFSLQLAASVTATLPWTSAVYDIEGIRPDGQVVSLIAPSPVVVYSEVTVWPV